MITLLTEWGDFHSYRSHPIPRVGVLFLHVFTLPVCIVDWPEILRKTLASSKEKITCTKMFFVAYSAAGCKAGLIFHATSNFCDTELDQFMAVCAQG